MKFDTFIEKENKALRSFLDCLKQMEDAAREYLEGLRRAQNKCIVCGKPAEPCLYDYCVKHYEEKLGIEAKITDEDREDHVAGDCLDERG